MKARYFSYALSSLLVCFLVAPTSNAQELVRTIETAHAGGVLAIDISTDGKNLLSGGADKRANIWEIQSGKKVKILSHGGAVTSVQYNANNSFYATGCVDKKVLVFNAETGKPKRYIKGHNGEVTSFCFSPINDQIVTASSASEVKLWDEKGVLVSSFKGHKAKVNVTRFSADGRFIASGSDDNTIKLWDPSNGQLVKSITTNAKSVTALDYSSDGRFLASGGSDNEVMLWNAANGERITKMSGHKSTINAIAFSPDVQYLVSVGDDNKIIIWNMQTKQPEKTLKAHNKGITSVAFSDKGDLLITGGKEGNIMVWDVSGLNVGKKRFAKSKGDPKLISSPLVLMEANNNGIVESGDAPSLEFSVKNDGKGQAYNLIAHVGISEQVDGLSFDKEHLIGNIDKSSSRKVSIPLRVGRDLGTASVKVTVTVKEANGFDAKPVSINFQTKGTNNYSYVMLVDHQYSSATGQAEVGAPITLKVMLQNTSQGNAENIRVNFSFPENVMAVDKLSEVIDQLGPGEQREVSVEFYANEDFDGDVIKPKMEIEGAAFTNVDDVKFEIAMNKNLPVNDDYNSMALAAATTSSGADGDAPVFRGGGDPLKGLNVSKAKEMVIGDYYALIIGIDAYQGHWTSLNNAVRDAESVEKMLKSKYKFDHFRSLYNHEATRESIIREMEWLVKNVKEQDNVFIYYSGHGEFKKELNKGYWVPVDATTSSTSEYISNSDIQTFIGGIKSKHTLLVSDACFSGDIFRGNTVSIPFEDSDKYYTNVHNLSSRKAITSGGVEPVMDGGRDGHSVFAYYLLKMLETNDAKYFDAAQLYDKIKVPVINNSEQTPNFSPVKNTGDEGGQFIFVRK